MACVHDHSCEDHDCSSDFSLYKHIDLSKILGKYGFVLKYEIIGCLQFFKMSTGTPGSLASEHVRFKASGIGSWREKIRVALAWGGQEQPVY
ncbi:hypothetical protein C5167_044429 [Papaver somniferum]|uniref:Uncharacterized protein n=1 Tax=Papaver somniferum TaxID=3469 RepID=A0A4Y7L9E2_PAPSO|nr:hypothetical protein C5167_044429 [Papaver somniferum]